MDHFLLYEMLLTLSVGEKLIYRPVCSKEEDSEFRKIEDTFVKFCCPYTKEEFSFNQNKSEDSSFSNVKSPGV
jgi:hypothetical protein